MPRGQIAEVGDEKVNQNGYRYVRTKDRGWVSKQQLLAEEHLGRELEPGDLIRIPDKTKRSDPTLQDIVITLRADRIQGSSKSRVLKLEAQISDLEDRLSFLREELAEAKREANQ
jgi:hypothetical protein